MKEEIVYIARNDEGRVLKPTDIKFEWCWHCMINTAMCNFCGGNACACGCYKNGHLPQEEQPCHIGGFWEAEQEAVKIGLRPKTPTSAEILDRIERIKIHHAKLDTPESEVNEFDHPIFSDEDYWYIKKYADLVGLEIPGYFELCESANLRTGFECRTGAEFHEERPEVEILDPKGWDSQISFETEKIPWWEYCTRRHFSETKERKDRE